MPEMKSEGNNVNGKDLKAKGSLIQFVGIGALLGVPFIFGHSLVGMLIGIALFAFCLFKGGSLHKQGRALLKQEKESKKNERVILKVPPTN